METKPWPPHSLVSEMKYLNVARILRCTYILCLREVVSASVQMHNCCGHRDSGSGIYRKPILLFYSRTWLVLIQEAFFCFQTSLLYNLYSPNLVQLFFYFVYFTASVGRIGLCSIECLMNDALERIWNEAVIAKSRYYARIYMEGLRNAVNNLCCDIRCPCRDASQVSPRIEEHYRSV
jgi:hypothetical protein